MTRRSSTTPPMTACVAKTAMTAAPSPRPPNTNEHQHQQTGGIILTNDMFGIVDVDMAA